MTKVYATNITDEQIWQLWDEAGWHSDVEMVAICERAINGSMRARRECARVLRENALETEREERIWREREARGF